MANNQYITMKTSPLPPPRGGINSLKKIKIVYKFGKCPFYNSLRVMNYLIPPLEGVGGGFEYQ